MQANHRKHNGVRIFSVVLLVMYALLTVGVNKATHFCMGREASVTLFSFETEKCPCELYAEATDDSCCDDEHDLIRIDDDQKSIQSYHISVPHLYILKDLYTEQLITKAAPAIDHSPSAVDIPPKVPIFVSTCSFVFYDSEAVSV